MPRAAAESDRRSQLLLLGAAAAGGVILLGLIASIGGPHNPLGGLAAVVYTLVRAGGPAAAYLLGGVGLGRLFRPLLGGAADPGALQVGLGIGLMLSLSHLLGWLGLFGGSLGMPVALGVCVAGLVMLGLQLRPRLEAGVEHIRLPWPVLLAAPAVAVMLVAACSPPGWLWMSEARGYDALSYHLQLPQEWLALGRLRPLEHNVYSFLPSYVEAAFYHLAAMTGSRPPSPGIPGGLLAGEGLGVLSCQLLHAGMAIIGAVLIGRVVLGLAGRDEQSRPRAAAGAALAGVLFLATPWTVVTGSLAYNDLGVPMLLAAGMVGAVERGLSPERRGAIAGLLVAFACGCKPTALFMAGPVVGALLLGCSPRREWGRLILWGSLAGVVGLAPWLVRNWLASGNPVFPVATGLFGLGHWTAEQAQRYAAGHSFGGSLVERLALLVVPGEATALGSGTRGVLHPQWAALFPVVVVAGAVAAWRRESRPAALLLAAGMAAQFMAWLFVTHLQSRFLIPLAVPGCVLVGLAARLGEAGPRRWLGPGLAAAACAMQTAATVAIFAGEGGGHPNQLLLVGPTVRTGGDVPAEQRPALLADPNLGPELFVNLGAPPGAVVYLLGDATPFYYTAPVRYNTTWDRWPLGEAMRAAPDRPAEWAAALRRQGITHVLANLGEIERLRASGWADPGVTADGVRAWLDGHARLVRPWPELGVALYELPVSPLPAPAPEPTR